GDFSIGLILFASLLRDVFALLHAGMLYTLIGQLIGPFVTRVAGMAAHPAPSQLMLLNLGIQCLPKVGVLHRFFIGGAPTAPLPVCQPLAHSLLHILGIRMDRN